MGQFRQAHRPVGAKPTRTIKSTMFAPLIVGFMLASFATFALAHVTGTAARRVAPIPWDLVVVGALAMFAIADLRFPRIRLSLLRRQTPRSLPARVPLPVAGFLWGVDTGSVFSTIRSSAASWAALVTTFGGWGPWWVGLAYGTAFSVPLALLIATYPGEGAAIGATGWRMRSTESFAPALIHTAQHIRVIAATAAILAVVVFVASSLFPS